MRREIGLILLLVCVMAPPLSAQPPAAAADVGPPTRTGPFQTFLDDFRALSHTSVWTVLAAGSVLSLAAGLTADQHLAERLDDGGHGTTAFGLVNTDIGAVAGETTFQIGVPLALYAAGQVKGHRQLSSLGSKLLRAQMLNGVLTKAIKLTRRPRPGGGIGSLPSGHTSTAAANATIVWRELGWKAGLPTALLATYVGASRLDQWHYLSDVIFGATIGIASGLAVDSETDRRFSVAPAVGRGVYGVTVTIGGGNRSFSGGVPGRLAPPRHETNPEHWLRPDGTIQIEWDGQVW